MSGPATAFIGATIAGLTGGGFAPGSVTAGDDCGGSTSTITGRGCGDGGGSRAAGDEADPAASSISTLAGLTVLDVDPAVVAFARKRLAKAPFPVSCIRHDLRDPLPPAFEGRFDAVLTDPPYTRAGAQLFLSRSAAAVREGGQVFLSIGPCRP